VSFSSSQAFSANEGAKEKGVASGREFILLTTALMASSALAIDLMLPAFPKMREEYGMSPDSSQVSWIVTAFFLGLAVGPWLYGPASDKYGRRGLLFAGLALYSLGGILVAHVGGSDGAVLQPGVDEADGCGTCHVPQPLHQLLCLVYLLFDVINFELDDVPLDHTDLV
jgi:MFS family permease